MKIGRIAGATRTFGAPDGWRAAQDGDCDALEVRDVPLESGANMMVSAWEPTPEERERIAAGAAVLLMVWGTGHPPVAVMVDEEIPGAQRESVLVLPAHASNQ